MKNTKFGSRATLYRGDCVQIMKRMKPDRFDTVICDPPYALTNRVIDGAKCNNCSWRGTGSKRFLKLNAPCPECGSPLIGERSYRGSGFMGKEWDTGKVAFDPTTWREVLRVSKPGAILLAFGGTRTWHRLCCAIEDAGWEIRDCVMWLYGSGFPKSMDISKAIDKTLGAKRRVIGNQKGKSGENLNKLSRPQGKDSKDAKGCGAYGQGAKQITVDIPLTESATDQGKLWEGYGTAMKPAWEPIVVAMKPLQGNFAKNALEWGVAGLNIDGTRIKCNGGSPAAARRASARKSGNAPMQERTLGVSKAADANAMGKIGRRGSAEVYMTARASEQKGRWPANLILDESAGDSLDQQSGTLKSGMMKASQRRQSSKGGGGYHGGFPDRVTVNGTYGDQGGASRFFYCAKASRLERGGENKHPTVKPINLMRYLCRLTKTPAGGRILDPFTGSGSTGIAALLEGRKFSGIEMDQDSFDTAVQRIQKHSKRIKPLFR